MTLFLLYQLYNDTYLRIFFLKKAKSAERAYIRYIIETTTTPYTGMHPQPYYSKELLRNTPTVVDPLTALAVTATEDEMQELDHDAAGSKPTQLQHEPIQPAVQTETESVAETDNLEAVPDIVDRLNRIMARIPPSGVVEEEPPAYHTT